MSFRLCVALVAAAAGLSTAFAVDRVEGSAEQDAREKAFSERMEKSVLVGSFTIDGQDLSKPPLAERYEIKSVSKAVDNLWIFTARVKYMKFDATLPITVPVEWAGDTPVVSLTDAALPGIGGGFSCRVIFDGDRYAGTWQHNEVGGHMFGSIEKQKAPDRNADDN